MPHHSTLAAGFASLLIASFGLSACSSHSDEESGQGGTGGGGGTSGYCRGLTDSLVNGSGVPKNPSTPLSETPVAASTCNAIERSFALEEPRHVEPCTPVDYSTNPPCTGTHYGVWAAYRTYDEPIPRGFWVHSLEHGAVVFAYSCSDCADEVTAAQALLDQIGVDPLCLAAGIPTRRTLLTPDPRLETSWAASSWGYTLTADCFEPEVFRAFVDAHRGLGPEGVCSDGVDVSITPP